MLTSCSVCRFVKFKIVKSFWRADSDYIHCKRFVKTHLNIKEIKKKKKIQHRDFCEKLIWRVLHISSVYDLTVVSDMQIIKWET